MNQLLRPYFALIVVLLPSMALSLEIDNRRHTSPVPDLVNAYVRVNTEVSPDLMAQQKILDDLHASILQEENALLQAALDDEEMEALDQLGQLLMQSRQELIKQGVKAIVMLKAEIGEDDFASLAGAWKSLDIEDSITVLHHSNPMPNLVDFVLLKDTKPALFGQQKERLQKWQSERAPVIAQQSLSVVEMESQLAEMTLNGDSIDVINELADNIAQIRVRIIRGKVFSRERIKQILQNAQYQVLLGRYPND